MDNHNNEVKENNENAHNENVKMLKYGKKI